MLYNVETQAGHILLGPSEDVLVVSQQSYQFISNIRGHARANLDLFSLFANT